MVRPVGSVSKENSSESLPDLVEKDVWIIMSMKVEPHGAEGNTKRRTGLSSRVAGIVPNSRSLTIKDGRSKITAEGGKPPLDHGAHALD